MNMEMSRVQKEVQGIGLKACASCKQEKPMVEFSPAKRKKRTRGVNDGTLTVQVIKEMVKAFKFCPYCGSELYRENTHLDHMKPLAEGGLHSKHNIIPCCSKCNLRKHDTPYGEWVERLREPYKSKAMSIYIERQGRC